jgi:hypothetical protein
MERVGNGPKVNEMRELAKAHLELRRRRGEIRTQRAAFQLSYWDRVDEASIEAIEAKFTRIAQRREKVTTEADDPTPFVYAIPTEATVETESTPEADVPSESVDVLPIDTAPVVTIQADRVEVVFQLTLAERDRLLSVASQWGVEIDGLLSLMIANADFLPSVPPLTAEKIRKIGSGNRKSIRKLVEACIQDRYGQWGWQ